MLAADKRRKDEVKVDRPAHVVAAQKAARAVARTKGGGGASSGGFASFRAMAENHVAFRAPAPVTRQEPVVAVSLPPAPVASVSHTDETSPVTSSE